MAVPHCSKDPVLVPPDPAGGVYCLDADCLDAPASRQGIRNCKTIDANRPRGNLNSSSGRDTPLSWAALLAVLAATALAEIILTAIRLGANPSSAAVAVLALLIVGPAAAGKIRSEAVLLTLLAVLSALIRIPAVLPEGSDLGAIASWSARGNPAAYFRCSTPVAVRCQVEELPYRPRTGEVRFGCAGEIIYAGADRVVPETVQGSILVSVPDLPWDPLAAAAAGERVSFEGKLKPVVCGDRSLPGWFDYSAYLLRRGKLGQIKPASSISRAGLIIAVSPSDLIGKNSASQSAAVSPNIAERLTADFPLERREALGILLAAVLGNRDLLSEEAAAAFQATGTTHLLVVSGFHVGIVFLLSRRLLFWLLGRSRRLLVRIALQPAAVSLALLAVSCYCALLDFDPIVVRSAVVVGFFALAASAGRRTSALPLLLLSLLIVISIWPGSFLDVSFQLTACACLALIFAGTALERLPLYHRAGPAARYLLATAVTSLSAACFTAPVVLLWFGTIAPLSPLINIAAIPFFGLGCIGGGAAGLALFYFGLPGGELILGLTAAATGHFLDFLNFCDEMSAGSPFGYSKLVPAEARLTSTLIAAIVLLAVAALRLSAKGGDVAAEAATD